MIRKALLMAAATVTAVVVTATPLPAQTAGADVRTWTGEIIQLAEPSLEVSYTIMIPSKEEGPGVSEMAPTTGAKTPILFGTSSTLGRFLDKQPEPLQGHRQGETITLRKNGQEIRLPLATISALTFARRAVVSSLPPWIASQHYRYSATAVLTDGSRIDGDYVSLGTTVLRGRTAQGRVDIPWEHIESVRFTR